MLRVSALPSALPGAYAFSVESLAAAQQVSSAALASGQDLVGAGTATISGGFSKLGTEVTGHTLTGGTYTLSVLSIDEGASEATVSFDGVEQVVSTGGGSFDVTAADGGTLSIGELGGSELATGSASISVFEADATSTVNNLATALNANGGPVRAQVIDAGDASSTSHRLILTARETGAAQAADIDLSALALFSGGLTTLRAAADAEVTLGGGGLTITRPTNTIGDLLDGVSMDLVGLTAGSDVEVVVSPDLDSRVEAVKSVIDGVTTVLRTLSDYSSYDVDAERGGPLVGSFSARSVSNELAVAMSTLVSSDSFVLLSQIGVSFERDGTYSLDEGRLREALGEDPAGVEAVLVGDAAVTDDGVLDILATTIDALVGQSGRIPTAKQGAEDNISRLESLIASQEVRLVNVEARLERQMAGLESLIGQLQSQSGFLSSIISQQQAAQ